MEFMRYRGVSSFVGTDSELIVYILDYLTSIAGLPVEKAARALVNPFENTLVSAEHSALGLGKYIEFRGAWLDGPFSVVAGYCDGEDVYMLALADRSKFRPLVVGEDGARIYVASEEAEIRALSEDADVWPVKPGGVFLASMKRGIILRGREHVQVFYRKVRTPPPSRGLVIDASGMSYSQINRLVREYFQSGAREVTVKNVNGHRYLGINVPPRMQAQHIRDGRKLPRKLQQGWRNNSLWECTGRRGGRDVRRPRRNTWRRAGCDCAGAPRGRDLRKG
jgi:hypothetical protein